MMRLIFAAAALSLPLLAQESAATTPGTSGGQNAKVVSPEVSADGRVTFRLRAAKANEVVLEGNWAGGRGLAMKKDAAGVWSAIAGPLGAELWAYTFSVDGVRTLDPANYNVARDGVGFMNTLVVPGEASLDFQTRAVPHGTMTAVWAPSSGLKASKRMFVYTPPGYESGNTRYPVLYLLHGSGGDEDAWPTMGIANVILDNLLAGGKARPMIVVMPNAYWNELASLDVAGPRTGPPPGVGSNTATVGYDANEKDIVNDIVPFIDKNYRTLANRENRALAGLSMGAGITGNVGLKRLDMFSAIGLMSSGMFRGNANTPAAGVELLDKLSQGVLANPGEANKKLRTLFISCGAEDPRIDSLNKVAASLSARKLNFTYKTYPGEHEWKVWRHSLADMAPLLFR